VLEVALAEHGATEPLVRRSVPFSVR